MTITYSRSEILACRPRQCPKLSLSLYNYRRLRLSELMTRFSTSRSRKRKRCVGTRFCLINTGSVVNKLETFTTIFGDHSPDVVALTETWLTHESGDQILSSMVPSGFSFIQVPRPSSRRGGGVGVVFKSTISATLVADSQTFDSFEHMDVRLKFGTRTLRLLVVYRPPRCSESDFLRDFSFVLELLSVTRDDLLIVGDFNLHVDDEHDLYGCSFMSLIDSFGLQQHVVGPTHERSATHKRHTLDLVMSRQRNHLVSKVCVGPRVISDHHPVVCVLDLHPPRWPTKKLLTRSFKSIDWDKFAIDIANLPLLSAPSCDLDGLVEQYNNGLRSVLDFHAPVRTRSVTLRPVNRWMTT
jgi:exonuclease III